MVNERDVKFMAETNIFVSRMGKCYFITYVFYVNFISPLMSNDSGLSIYTSHSPKQKRTCDQFM